MSLRRREYLGEAITSLGIDDGLDRIIGNAESLAKKFKGALFVKPRRLEFAAVLERASKRLIRLAARLRKQ